MFHQTLHFLSPRPSVRLHVERASSSININTSGWSCKWVRPNCWSLSARSWSIALFRQFFLRAFSSKEPFREDLSKALAPRELHSARGHTAVYTQWLVQTVECVRSVIGAVCTECLHHQRTPVAYTYLAAWSGVPRCKGNRAWSLVEMFGGFGVVLCVVSVPRGFGSGEVYNEDAVCVVVSVKHLELSRFLKDERQLLPVWQPLMGRFFISVRLASVI